MINSIITMETRRFTKAARTFRLLADPTRLKLIRAIEAGRGKLCVSELAQEIGASISATSHQLAKLEKMGVVSACRTGKEICYCIEKDAPATRHVLALLKLARV